MAVPHPIKAELAMRRIPNTRFAEQVGLNAASLGRVINGHLTPWPALRARCAEALGIPEDELFRTEETVGA